MLALGTNDTADVYVGSPVSLATRIKEMMSLIGNQPVMWVNVKSLLDQRAIRGKQHAGVEPSP